MNTLQDLTQADQVRLRALATIIHLIGDMHQPLHAVVLDGYQVIYKKNLVGFHRFWDTSAAILARRLGPERDDNIRKLAIENKDDWMAGSPVDWTMESYRLTLENVFPALGAQVCPLAPQAIVLSPEIIASFAVIAARRLAQAGVRIAFVLNASLKDRISR